MRKNQSHPPRHLRIILGAQKKSQKLAFCIYQPLRSYMAPNSFPDMKKSVQVKKSSLWDKRDVCEQTV